MTEALLVVRPCLEQTLCFVPGIMTEKRTLCSLVFPQITYDEENRLSSCWQIITLFQESIQSYPPRRTRGFRHDFLLWRDPWLNLWWPAMTNGWRKMKYPNTSSSSISAESWCIVALASQHIFFYVLAAFWKDFFMCVNNTQLQSLQGPTVRVVLCQGTCSLGQCANAEAACHVCGSTGLFGHLGCVLLPGN